MKPIQKNKKTHKQTQRDLKQKMNMFDRLPENCLTCLEPFDRKNKEQVQSWFVVVRSKENKVHLYCPVCYSKAQNIVKEYYEQKDQQLGQK